MRAYGTVATGTVGERGIDLPTAPLRRPDRDLGVNRRAVRSPIPPVPREDPDAVAAARKAERAAVAEKAQADRRAAVALRAAGKAEERRKDREAAAERRAAAVAARPARPKPAAKPQRTVRQDRTARDRAAEQAAARQVREQLKAALLADVRERYERGDHLADIAAALHISVVQVQRLRAEAGCDLRRKPLDRAEVVRLYAEVRSVEKVAERLGTVAAAVRYHLKHAGVDVRKPGDNGRQTPAETRAEAVRRYAAGVPPVEIMRALEVSESSLLRWVRAAGVPRRPTGCRGALSEAVAGV